MTELAQLTDIELLALMVAGEADNQPLEGKVAVAMTVMARLDRQRSYYGLTVRDIILRPYQYSTFNANHWRRFTQRIPAYIQLAELAIKCLLISPAQGATHYCRFDLKPMPTWTQKQYSTLLGRIGQHNFYQEE